MERLVREMFSRNKQGVRESFVYLGGTIYGNVRSGTDSQEYKSLVKRLEKR